MANMRKLSRGQGPLPAGWGFPSPVYMRTFLGRRIRRSGGMVWNGSQPPTQSDIDALMDYMPEAQIDPGTLVGRADKNYSTFSERNKQTQRIRLG